MKKNSKTLLIQYSATPALVGYSFFAILECHLFALVSRFFGCLGVAKGEVAVVERGFRMNITLIACSSLALD